MELTQIPVLAGYVPMTVSSLALLVSVMTLRANMRLNENAGILDLARRYDELAAAMAKAEGARDQHRSMAGMLNYLETAAYFHNHKRVGRAVKSNIRAIIADFIAGMESAAFGIVLDLYGPGPDAYDELRKFGHTYRVLIERQRAAMKRTILELPIS